MSIVCHSNIQAKLPQSQSHDALGAGMAGFLAVGSKSLSNKRKLPVHSDSESLVNDLPDQTQKPKHAKKGPIRECCYSYCKAGKIPQPRMYEGVLHKYDGLKTIWKSGLARNVKRYCNIHILECDPPFIQDFDL